MPLELDFLDSGVHHSTLAQANQKSSSAETAMVAGMGAFGAPGFNGSKVLYCEPTQDQEAIGHLKTTPAALPFAKRILAFTTNPVESHIIFYLTADGRVVVNRQDYIGFGGVETTIATSDPGKFVFNVQHMIHALCTIDSVAGEVDFIIDGASAFGGPVVGVDTQSNGGSWGAPAAEVTLVRYYSSNEWSHIALGRGFTGQPRTGCTFASGVGASSDWTPSGGPVDNYEMIDEVSPTDDKVSADAPNLKDMYKFDNDLPLGAIILAVVVTAEITKSEAGVCEACLVVGPPGGVDADGPTFEVPASKWFAQAIWELNPDTGNPWTVGEVNDPDFEAGVKSITVTA